MKDRLRINELNEYFRYRNVFTRHELYEFYQGHNYDLKETTFRWMIYELRIDGIIKNLDRGIYTLINNGYDGRGFENRLNDFNRTYSMNRIFRPNFNEKIIEISNNIKQKFPYLRFSLWDTRWLNEFMLHQVSNFLIIIETERETEEAIYYYISNYFENVFLKPNSKEFDIYVNRQRESIVIKRMITESPLTNIDNVNIPRLEKILVDLFADEVSFLSFEGTELVNIYQNAFKYYMLDLKTMLRYASRRRRKLQLVEFLQKIDILNNGGEYITKRF